MLTDVVSRALGHSAADRTFRVSFIGDWALHLDVLLPDGAFDLGYPWFKPDCTRLELLSPPMQRRCTDYHWSQPLHELVVGYFVRAGGPVEGTVDPADLVGLTFCRPRGYYTFDLEQRGLGVPAVTLVTPEEPGDCLRALINGEVDVVPLSVTLVEGEIGRLGLAGQVAELPELADILTLHVLSHRSNPFGRTYLTLINRGLREMRDTGEWFQVVARHLAEYSEATQ
jgi:polar amino acid transport system substrate-binding protein